MSYQPSIPAASDLLSVSQSGLQTNFTQLNNVFAVDHVTFNPAVANSGKHNKVTLPQQASTPATAALEGVIYTKAVAGVMSLLYRDQSDGVISQLLSTNVWDSGSSSGTISLGTTLINYGNVSVAFSGNTTQVVIYKTAFLSPAYVPYLISKDVSGPLFAITASAAGTFSITVYSGGSGTANFSYLAIGPAVVITP